MPDQPQPTSAPDPIPTRPPDQAKSPGHQLVDPTVVEEPSPVRESDPPQKEAPQPQSGSSQDDPPSHEVDDPVDPKSTPLPPKNSPDVNEDPSWWNRLYSALSIDPAPTDKPKDAQPQDDGEPTMVQPVPTIVNHQGSPKAQASPQPQNVPNAQDHSPHQDASDAHSNNPPPKDTDPQSAQAPHDLPSPASPQETPSPPSEGQLDPQNAVSSQDIGAPDNSAAAPKQDPQTTHTADGPPGSRIGDMIAKPFGLGEESHAVFSLDPASPSTAQPAQPIDGRPAVPTAKIPPVTIDLKDFGPELKGASAVSQGIALQFHEPVSLDPAGNLIIEPPSASDGSGSGPITNLVPGAPSAISQAYTVNLGSLVTAMAGASIVSGGVEIDLAAPVSIDSSKNVIIGGQELPASPGAGSLGTEAGGGSESLTSPGAGATVMGGVGQNSTIDLSGPDRASGVPPTGSSSRNNFSATYTGPETFQPSSGCQRQSMSISFIGLYGLFTLVSGVYIAHL